MRHVAFALLLLAAPLAAQEPTPPFDLAPLPDQPFTVKEASVEQVGGAPVAIVPAPAAVPDAVVEEVADVTAENFKDVESGDVDAAELTRDASKSPDGGASLLFPVLLAFAAAVAKYAIDQAVRRHPSLSNSTIGLISHGTVLVVVAVGFFALHNIHPDLPKDLSTWLAWAGLGGAGGSMASSGAAVKKYGVVNGPAKVSP